MQYYNFQLMMRENNHLLLFRDLLNVYIVDMYAKIEGERLLFFRQNQKKLRSEQYCHLRDSLNTDNAESMGKQVILRSSFVGSPRYMCERIQDGVVYIRNFGTADLFTTFTCNKNWDEIQQSLLPH